MYINRSITPIKKYRLQQSKKVKNKKDFRPRVFNTTYTTLVAINLDRHCNDA